ncbi:hypothetical protein CSE16_08015 [Solibacillus sp. R5-41]|uniref:hypothetical protein n=1 Tax=Solibacillus sp. R5-41 TaxID=2048654 RepID=UPI000C1279B3|nr:hypothetical protein [Solibacillus sp. R5-41]ATP39999.1 hypothetical protein CSE16_08015 [Solibacillus sp. R5-41]
MKRQLFFSMGFILILTGCSESEVSEGPEEVKEILIEKVDLDKDVAQSTEISSENYETDSGVVSYDMDISEGSLSGTEFSPTYKLSSSNGKNVDFHIVNTGNVDVKISINGEFEETFAPGEGDYITAPVALLAKDYKFKAVPTPNGGKISIDYRITQRD